MGTMWAAVLLALAVAACAPVSIRTPAEEPDACMDALLSGTLARHPQTGLGVADPDGTVVPVEWPFGYSARSSGTAIALLDGTGSVVALEGQRVQVGGGMGPGPGANAVWFACGPVRGTEPGSP